MDLGITQPLTEMSTRSISWGIPPTCDHCLEIWELQPTGTLRACPCL